MRSIFPALCRPQGALIGFARSHTTGSGGKRKAGGMAGCPRGLALPDSISSLLSGFFFRFYPLLSYSFWINIYPGLGIDAWVSGENRFHARQTHGNKDFITSMEMGMKWGNGEGFPGDSCGKNRFNRFFTRTPKLWANPD
jgi:hypothetical protein